MNSVETILCILILPWANCMWQDTVVWYGAVAMSFGSQSWWWTNHTPQCTMLPAFFRYCVLCFHILSCLQNTHLCVYMTYQYLLQNTLCVRWFPQLHTNINVPKHTCMSILQNSDLQTLYDNNVYAWEGERERDFFHGLGKMWKNALRCSPELRKRELISWQVK